MVILLFVGLIFDFFDFIVAVRCWRFRVTSELFYFVCFMCRVFFSIFVDFRSKSQMVVSRSIIKTLVVNAWCCVITQVPFSSNFYTLIALFTWISQLIAINGALYGCKNLSFAKSKKPIGTCSTWNIVLNYFTHKNLSSCNFRWRDWIVSKWCAGEKFLQVDVSRWISIPEVLILRINA